MKKSRIFMGAGLIALPIASFGLFGFASPNSSQVTKPTPPSLTAAQRQQILDNIGVIETPYGTFVRADQSSTLPNLSSTAIAHSKADMMNPNIQEAQLPYGTFVKTNTQGVKNFIKQWQSDH